MVRRGSMTDHKRNSNRAMYYSWVLEEVQGLKGLHGEVKAECGQRIGPGAHVLGSIGKML